MERYELVEGKSSKFWEVSVDGTTLTVNYGRIGTQGQSKEKEFDSADAALKEKNKLVKEKTGKGYSLTGSGLAAPAKKQAEPAKPKETVEEAQPSAAAASANTSVTAETPVAEVSAPVAPAIPAEQIAKPAAKSVPSVSAAQAPAGGPSPVLKSLIGLALPTRSRSQGSLDPARAWDNFADNIKLLTASPKAEAKEAAQWINERLGENGPKPVGGGAVRWLKSKIGGQAEMKIEAADVIDWLQHIGTVSNGKVIEGPKIRNGKQPAGLLCLIDFQEWLLGVAGASWVLQILRPLIGANTNDRRAYGNSCWSSPLELALRLALTKLSDEEYEAAITTLTEDLDAQVSWEVRASRAFVLGDDRSIEHDLKPLAVLRGAEAAGVEVGAQLAFLPLIAELAPSDGARWRTKRSYFFYFGYVDIPMEDVLATVIDTAAHHHQSPVPALDWFLHYAYDDRKTVVAKTILATGDDGAMAVLAPILHDKWIRAALDEFSEADPATSFRHFVTALASGRTEPVIRSRVMDFLKAHPAETQRQWLAGNDRALAYLDRLHEVQNVPLAAAENVPSILLDPPWRKKKKKVEDIVLALKPQQTAFRYETDPAAPDQRYWRAQRAVIAETTDDLIKTIAKIEEKPTQSWYKIPALSRPLPQLGDDQADVLGFAYERIMQIYRASSWGLRSSDWSGLFDGIDKQPDSLALMLWSCPGAATGYYAEDVYTRMMDRFGERGLPGLLRQIENDPIVMIDLAKNVDAGEIAPHAARALIKLKKARVAAMHWLRRHRETAIIRLIPDATGPKGVVRDAAEFALRWIATDREDGRAAIEAIAQTYTAQDAKAPEAVVEVLDRDPLQRFPARIAKVPDWFKPSSFTRPVLKEGGALSDEAMVAIAEMLSFSTPEAIYAGIDVLKETTRPESLSAFAWDVFAAWLADGAPSKEGWALRGIGWLGDDECARKLTRLVRKWPGEAAHARAVTGLDVLADIGTDVALMNLNGIAEKLKFKGLQEKAREKIAQLAEARDLTPEELADRLAPDLDLDDRGGMDLVFGERQFRVGFDEFLKPWVKDETGKRLKDLPKPNKSDDQELAGDAVKRWAALKKDARAASSIQITRLENMLSMSRRTTPDVFWMFFASHPLIRHLTQRLVWGVYADRDPRTAPTTIFRVSDDLSVTDAQDDTIDLDFSPEASGVIGLVHPLHLPAGGLDAWGALFGDYEISQPFPQLGREIHELTEAEKQVSEISRFEGLKVESPRLRGMGSRGWALGAPQDGGAIWWLERPIRLLDGKAMDAMFYFGDGIFTGGGDWEDKLQTLGKLSLEPPYGRSSGNAPKFGQLDPVTASETLRGLALLAETAVK